jgi:hypothetical protein
MKHGKCVGCNKSIKAGEFVVMNGGAMIKTKTGAMMGDKNLLGFLTINNHFDSKKNYRTMIIADNAPNGQFEYYSCSHKCLANFISKQIMHLAKIDKFKKIVLAPQSMLDKIGYEWGLKVVELMGFKGALITDQSTVSNFMYSFEQKDKLESGRTLRSVSKKLGFEVKETDYIWKIAREYKVRQRDKLIKALYAKGLSKAEITKRIKDHRDCFVKPKPKFLGGWRKRIPE